MKFVVATLLVVVSITNAEPPRFGPSPARQVAGENAPPYAARGWRPQGPQFNLPEQQQQPTYNNPSDRYGPPQQQTSADANNEDRFAKEPQVETFNESWNSKKPARVQQQQEQTDKGGAYYLLLPQQQNYVVASSPIVAKIPFSSALTGVYQPYTASVVQIY